MTQLIVHLERLAANMNELATKLNTTKLEREVAADALWLLVDDVKKAIRMASGKEAVVAVKLDVAVTNDDLLKSLMVVCQLAGKVLEGTATDDDKAALTVDTKSEPDLLLMPRSRVDVDLINALDRCDIMRHTGEATNYAYVPEAVYNRVKLALRDTTVANTGSHVGTMPATRALNYLAALRDCVITAPASSAKSTLMLIDNLKADLKEVAVAGGHRVD